MAKKPTIDEFPADEVALATEIARTTNRHPLDVLLELRDIQQAKEAEEQELLEAAVTRCLVCGNMWKYCKCGRNRDERRAMQKAARKK